MRRRLEMARALLHDPDLLLLDEPTTGVDPGQRQALWDALASATERRRTILLATNDLLEADAVCDHVAFIRNGRATAAGTPAQLKAGLRAETLRIEWADPSPEVLGQVGQIGGVGEVTTAEGVVQISCDHAALLVPELFAIAGNRITSIAIHQATLEDAYFRYAGAPIEQESAA
jgi:ABC-2 type transport system ATP-binding protein